jgi:hypothetical protein
VHVVSSRYASIREVPMTTHDESNRRRTNRHMVRMICQAVRERDFTLIGEVALDLSIDGMLVRTKKDVLTGENVIVSFFEPHTATWFDLEATIARVIHARRIGDVERCVALSFHGISAADRERLERALAHRPGSASRTRATAAQLAFAA